VNVCLVMGAYHPGKCGISDYVKLLGDELQRKGHSFQRISIGSQDCFLKLAKNIPDADLISLQFAPYSFSTKGLTRNALLEFAKAFSKRKTQVNFHEIWIGAYPRAPWKEKFHGWRQKREILKFLETIQPDLVHATNAAAVDRLKRECVNAEYLYLFGNIPYMPIPTADLKNNDKLHVAFFGTLYKSFPYSVLGKRLETISKTSKRPLLLTVIGRHRESKGLGRLNNLANARGFEVELTGELEPKAISHHFQKSDIGVSTTPYDVLGKSGATAAMLEHGLPVFAYDDGDTLLDRLFTFERFRGQTFLLNDYKSPEKLLSFLEKPRRPFFDGVAHTTNKMLDSIY
jgi:hypothetical protein